MVQAVLRNFGSSPRGAQALIRAAKVKALIDGRYAVAIRDLHDIAHPALRHRITRSFEAEAEGVTTDHIVERLLQSVPREGDVPTSTAPNRPAAPGSR